MAKSLRSKTKRTFRRIKREDSAFSVAHAARLERLSSKLAKVKEQPVEGDQDESGWSPYSLFGLVDPDYIQVDNVGGPTWLGVIKTAMSDEAF
jgi:hypothetical protein